MNRLLKGNHLLSVLHRRVALLVHFQFMTTRRTALLLQRSVLHLMNHITLFLLWTISHIFNFIRVLLLFRVKTMRLIIHSSLKISLLNIKLNHLHIFRRVQCLLSSIGRSQRLLSNMFSLRKNFFHAISVAIILMINQIYFGRHWSNLVIN